jgi:hypothetical protein
MGSFSPLRPSLAAPNAVHLLKRRASPESDVRPSVDRAYDRSRIRIERDASLQVHAGGMAPTPPPQWIDPKTFRPS